MIRISRSVGVSEASGVAEARRIAVSCAEALRLSETATARTALVATELATNLVKHGNGGAILIGSDETTTPASMVLAALDKGAGIQHPDRAMSDGFSTAGSAGQGLGAIGRASASFDLYSLHGRGTVAVAVVNEETARTAERQRKSDEEEVAGVCMPLPTETEVGDAWIAIRDAEGVTITVADGLGHGPQAAIASNAALRIAREESARSLEDILRAMHDALRSTRGAAIGIARIRAAQRRVDFAGIGNIAGVIVGDEVRRTVSQPGIIGHELRKVQTFSYPWSPSSTLILQSDGVGTSWHLDDYPGAINHSAAVIAATLYRDFCRGTDDATVVVTKGGE